MKNTEIDDRIYDEILVDCKDEYEQNMSWYYYAQEELQFPFEAQIALKKTDGGKEIKKVRVVELSDTESDFDRNFDLKVKIELNEYVIEESLSKLEEVDASEGTMQVVEDWKYWINKG